MSEKQETNTAATGLGELPELPAVKHGLPYTATDYYTADQMRAYATAALAAQPAPVVGGLSELLEQLRGELAADKGWDYTEYERGRLAEKERVISQLAPLAARPGGEGSK